MAIPIDTADAGLPEHRIIESAFGQRGMSEYEIGGTPEDPETR